MYFVNIVTYLQLKAPIVIIYIVSLNSMINGYTSIGLFICHCIVDKFFDVVISQLMIDNRPIGFQKKYINYVLSFALIVCPMSPIDVVFHFRPAVARQQSAPTLVFRCVDVANTLDSSAT